MKQEFSYIMTSNFLKDVADPPNWSIRMFAHPLQRHTLAHVLWYRKHIYAEIINEKGAINIEINFALRTKIDQGHMVISNSAHG